MEAKKATASSSAERPTSSRLQKRAPTGLELDANIVSQQKASSAFEHREEEGGGPIPLLSPLVITPAPPLWEVTDAADEENDDSAQTNSPAEGWRHPALPLPPAEPASLAPLFEVSVSNLEGKIVALYISCNRDCCSEFSPILAQIYKKLKEIGESFEVVLVSLEDDESYYDETIENMPWLAFPFNDKSCDKLFFYFEYEFEAWEAFPFSQEKLHELSEKVKARLESQTLKSLLVSDDLDYVIGKNELKNVHHAGQPMPGEEQEDIVITSTQNNLLNMKCPLTGKPVTELQNLVRWMDCKHIYEKEPVIHYISTKKPHPQCPVAATSYQVAQKFSKLDGLYATPCLQ
ncbi:hypothetical protein ZIOFF_051376 [Zingiber officinale]|uniref:protein-disulfide reductase n=1 Tax=Zingiber officinale TaxID=94328 RepID=A0A8J5FLY2_ZINOF|nr:hypothetical protein ZIOFF_051376 [Zingiber officinale]